MMMFVTLSLILLAFFILLNSMAVIDDKKQRKALGSLLGSFGMLPGGDSVDEDIGNEIRDRSVIKHEGILMVFQEAQKEAAVLIAKAMATPEDIELNIDETTGEIKLVLAERLLFAPGTAVVSPHIFPILNKIASIAKKADGRTKVTGHTDNKRAAKGHSNWELSLRRGAIVARHLEAVGRLTRGKIRASGASHHKGLKDNKEKKGRAANRRVEILVKTRKDGV